MKPEVTAANGGWALRCGECDDTWDYDRWDEAIRDAIVHNRWHVGAAIDEALRASWRRNPHE